MRKLIRLKAQFENALNTRRDELSAAELATKLANESIDVSLVEVSLVVALHPISLGFSRLIAILRNLDLQLQMVRKSKRIITTSKR